MKIIFIQQNALQVKTNKVVSFGLQEEMSWLIVA